AVPLRWNQMFGIATRAPASGAAATRPPPAEVLTEFARDAVRADARPSEPPFWFQNAECLNQSLGTASATNARGRTIAYPRNDAIARAIAERIVALAWPRPRSPLWLRELLPVDYASAGAPSVVGLPENALPDSLRAGHGLAYVLALPRIDADVCAIAVVADPAARVIANSPGLRFTPLLDTRSYLIYRPGIGRVLLDGDGTLRFAGGGS
ncbi:MAG TPA: hypothetical protein VK864_05305, partial [Longimicrobiales bacterium]|nr:hypothetical protein [Longimicrobiales bacterium]